MRIDYRTTDLLPYINWAYFYHAWGVPSGTDEAVRLRHDADRTLAVMRPYVKVRCAVEVLPAHSEGDDIVVEKTVACSCGQCHTTGDVVRLPMLRQQTPNADGYCLCLSDFISPKADRIGVFATSVAMKGGSVPGQSEDSESSEFSEPSEFSEFSELSELSEFSKATNLMTQILHDRLAEAAAERLHEDVRKRIWGYASDEHLTMEELHSEAFQGIRPAVGYPCLPDISLNFALDELIDFASIGVTLTTNGMMQPHASVSGLMLSHPAARYFGVGKIDETQLRDYAQRRKMDIDEARKYLGRNI